MCEVGLLGLRRRLLLGHQMMAGLKNGNKGVSSRSALWGRGEKHTLGRGRQDNGAWTDTSLPRLSWPLFSERAAG